MIANEGDLVELKDGILVNTSTDDSKRAEVYNQNKKRFIELFSGEWTLDTVKDNKKVSERFKIDDTGKYVVNDKAVYDLLISDFNDNRIVLNKIDMVERTIISTETLKKMNDRLVTGQDKSGIVVQYQKVN